MINNPKIIQEFLERVNSIPAKDIKKAVDEVLKEEKKINIFDLPVENINEEMKKILSNKTPEEVLKELKECGYKEENRYVKNNDINKFSITNLFNARYNKNI